MKSFFELSHCGRGLKIQPDHCISINAKTEPSLSDYVRTKRLILGI